MNNVIYNLLLTNLFSICMIICMVTKFMGRACNHSLLLVLPSSPQINSNISQINIFNWVHPKNAVWIYPRIKRQQENKGNSTQTVKLLQPWLLVLMFLQWVSEMENCLLKKEWLRLSSFRCSCPPKLKDQAHSMDSTGIFTSALHKLLSAIMTSNLLTEQGGKGKTPSHFWVEKQKFPFLWTSLSADDLSDVKALTEAHPGAWGIENMSLHVDLLMSN